MFEHEPFGTQLKLYVRGASHAPTISFRLEGMPSGFKVNEEELARFMRRRAPGQDELSTQRCEDDDVRLTARRDPRDDGTQIIEGVIANRDARPGDYGAERTVPRPGHADFGQWVEMGRIPTGGGANSGRMTVALCAAGGICLQYLAKLKITVVTKINSVGAATEPRGFKRTIRAAMKSGDSVGGTLECRIHGVKPGIGGALFAGIDGALAAAMFAIPGVKGVEVGDGFGQTGLRGSRANDPFTVVENGTVRTICNRHGGVLGGRTSGMPITIRLAVRPTPTIFKEQDSVDLATMKPAKLTMKGRHDPCILMRAMPVVEAMAGFTIADAILRSERATPRICLTLTGRTIDEDLKQFMSQRLFVDMVELRVDLLDEAERCKVDDIPFLMDCVPVILTFRRKRDGGEFTGDDEVRRKFFESMLACGFAYVDFEDDFRIPALEEKARRFGVQIIRSLHDFKGRCFKSKRGNMRIGVDRICEHLRGKNGDMPKFAFMPNSLADVSRVFHEAAKMQDRRHIICAMGPLGMATRVLAGRLGNLLTYTSVGGLADLGHITPHELVRTYRFRSQRSDWTLYGVTGWPLKATRSPEIHNAAFADADEDALMIPFPAATAREAIAFAREMGMRALAVTIPHKRNMFKYSDELTVNAQAIGAVNTLLIQCDGTLVGENTDADGFADALKRFLNVAELSGKKVALLGDGGAAAAVRFALERMDAEVETFHRRPLTPGFDVIVNATPVDPIPEYEFTGREAVYDLVYCPEETPLIARARKAGCRVRNGFSMLVAQAERQREFWSKA